RQLRTLGVALRSYNDTYGHLPPPAIVGKNGKPLLSWRVAILPYIEQHELYKQFKLDEPWDSPHNKKLIARMPDVFAAAGKTPRPGMTYYQYIVGPGAVFRHNRLKPGGISTPGGSGGMAPPGMGFPAGGMRPSGGPGGFPGAGSGGRPGTSGFPGGG